MRLAPLAALTASLLVPAPASAGARVGAVPVYGAALNGVPSGALVGGCAFDGTTLTATVAAGGTYGPVDVFVNCSLWDSYTDRLFAQVVASGQHAAVNRVVLDVPEAVRMCGFATAEDGAPAYSWAGSAGCQDLVAVA